MTIQVTIKNTDTVETRAVKYEQSANPGQSDIIKAGEEQTLAVHADNVISLSEIAVEAPAAPQEDAA